MQHAVQVLKDFDVPHEKHVVSAHRTPVKMARFAAAAEGRGVAGHPSPGPAAPPICRGMTAAHTALPVLGVPVESRALKGLDSLLSIAQMPAGVPVGCLAIGKAGATNAGLLAVGILALANPALQKKLHAFRSRQTRTVLKAVLPKMTVVPPGSAVGVLGSGQLGRMFALAARRLGYRGPHIFSRVRHPHRPSGRRGNHGFLQTTWTPSGSPGSPGG
jgi:phosphoribosylaminoimidazole carboxylase PurE protein